MKTFNELTSEQQAKAREHFLQRNLQCVTEGFVSWLPQEERAKVMLAIAEAERLRTPWFLGAIVYEKSKDFYDAVALEDAKVAKYSERTDAPIVPGIA